MWNGLRKTNALFSMQFHEKNNHNNSRENKKQD